MKFWEFLSSRWGIPTGILRQILPYSEFMRQKIFWEMEPWGEDWKQAAKVVQTLYAQKGIRVETEEIICPRRRPTTDPVMLGKYLWAGLKALASQWKSPVKKIGE